MADKENTENKEEKKSGLFNLKTLMILVPILIFQIVLSYFLMNNIFRPKFQTNPQMGKTEKVEEKNIGEIYLIEDIIVNPKQTLGRRFINVSLGLECRDGAVSSEIEKKNVKIRDYLITLFSNCTFDELDDAADKEHLRKVILADLNKMISNKGINAVYFTNFVLQ